MVLLYSLVRMRNRSLLWVRLVKRCCCVGDWGLLKMGSLVCIGFCLLVIVLCDKTEIYRKSE